MKTKLFISILLVLAVIAFGILFWIKFFVHQENLANTPLPNNETMLTGRMSSEFSTLETELNEIDVNNIDENSAELRAEANEL